MRKKEWLIPEELLHNHYLIFAHQQQGKAKETLTEHINLCQYYYQKLYQTKQMELFFINILKHFMLFEDSVGQTVFWEMLDNVVTFHDFGKINPQYQRIVMEEPIPASYYVDWLAGKQHSLLSAFFYQNHYMKKIQQLDVGKEQKRMLHGFCLINGMVISRHHSNLCAMQTFIGEYEPGGNLAAIAEGITETGFFLKETVDQKSDKYPQRWRNFCKYLEREQGIGVFWYSRFLYSLLVTCDYYATTQYMSGVRMDDFGVIGQVNRLQEAYEKTALLRRIREGQANEGINALRTSIFLEVEQQLLNDPKADLYFLEAPTGSGKSNTAMNVSFQLLAHGGQKIYYVYPFNTLVEQNLATLEETFGTDSSEFQQIAVINSNTPMKQRMTEPTEEWEKQAMRILLDRQFLNYPFLLTTHVTLFQTMFAAEREAVFGFLQLQNSIIVLDEIQSYKNTIWSEMIMFLKSFAKYLNSKVVIMSATLPNLTNLTADATGVVTLMKEPERYFQNPLFRERVVISYELLSGKIVLEQLRDHLLQHYQQGMKVVIEFIKKKSAYAFMHLLKAEKELMVDLCLMTGDDNRADRIHKIKRIKDDQAGLILVATQVIEAGVDIDMDLGYKDISKLDSEEQFMGRINRSCKLGKRGQVYFFDLDDASRVYCDGDFRMNRELTLEREEMQHMLKEKNFAQYYQQVMTRLKDQKNDSLHEDDNLVQFFDQQVRGLDFAAVAKRMRLIEDSDWDMSVFLSRIMDVDGQLLDGEVVWQQYVELLQNNELEYAQKQVALSQIKCLLNYFIYQIRKNPLLDFSDQVGELYKIDHGQDYFDKDGIFLRDKLEKRGELFF